MDKLNIRNDIQSLRGLSVILIFLFHFDQVFFKYLYVGVDIFFIISGYVITNSIINSIRDNRFDIFKYFLRRIKRIYPGLICFLIIFNISFFIFVSFNDGEFIQIIFSSISSFFGISNFFYIFTPNLDYFDDKIKWLQHTWSLSNEIQFYILIGLIFIVLNKFINFKRNTNALVFALVLISILSFFLFLFGNTKLLSDYYSSFSRFWEFFFGSLAYLLNFEKFKLRKLNFNFLVLIFILILILVNFTIPNLSYKTIIIFSVLFISFTIFFSDKHNLTKIHDVFIYYGNISFSFFLWHLPIISFLKIYNQNILINFLASFLITTIISHLSYKYVEIKFNQKHKTNNNSIFLIKFLSVIVTFSIILLFNNITFLDKTRNFLYQNVIKFYPIVRSFNIPGINDNINDNWILPYDTCSNSYENFSFSRGVNCIVDQGSENLFFIAGNSFGDHIVPAFSMLNKSTIYKSRFENCYVAENMNINCNNKSKIIVNSFREISKNFKKKYFVISLTSGNYDENKLSEIFKILPKETKILLIYPHPITKIFNKSNLLKEYERIKRKDFKTFNVLKNNYNINIFDTYSFLCTDRKCDKNYYEKLFIDGAHFKVSSNSIISNNLLNFISMNGN